MVINILLMKSTNEQLSGKNYEYFVGRNKSAISELGHILPINELLILY